MSERHDFNPSPVEQSKVDNFSKLYENLTPREKEVLYLFARGKSAEQIAEDLSISKATAAVHRANLLEKLKISKMVVASRLFTAMQERQTDAQKELGKLKDQTKLIDLNSESEESGNLL